MVSEGLRQELVGMQEEDFRVRQKLIHNNELGGPCVQTMRPSLHRLAACYSEILISPI
jgi:hypothetical protein